jgi:hypothetical protein
MQVFVTNINSRQMYFSYVVKPVNASMINYSSVSC